MLHSFGREDQFDRDAIKRLVVSLTRLLDPATALSGTQTAGSAGLAFTSSRPVGGTLVLDALWRRLGIDTVMTRLLAGGKRDPRTERVLFALVANRALAPGSKLAAAGWVNRRAHIDGLAATSDDACYRAMDWLLDIAPDLEREVFWQVATLLDHEVDLLFFDTTSTYFETDHPDAPVARDAHGRPVPDQPNRPEEVPDSSTDPGSTDAGSTVAGSTVAGADGVGFRTYGKSKDSRDDLPQVVIGMAVTRAGIPVRVWCWPGNTTDSALIRQAREDMRDWTLARVMWVADRGFSSRAEDIALGYKQLLEVDRGWRDMKTTLELRPVYHRLEDRIRAHVILCWLALLLVRLVETTTGDTWNRVREDLQELHVGTFEGPAGTFRQRTELTTAQRDILTQLDIDAP